MNDFVLNYRLLPILIAVLFAAACSDLPRDPRSTLRQAEGGVLRVGLVEHPPFVVRSGGEPVGAEVELIKRFAQQINAAPEWHWGGEQEQMQALEHFELDLLVGGLTDETAWKNLVALSNPYFKDHIVVAVPATMLPPETVKGIPVAVRSGDVAAAYLENKGANPVRIADLKQAGKLPVAAAEWELEQLGLTPTKVDLGQQRHVIAAPPGENAFLKRLNEFLRTQRPEVKTLLQQQGQQEARR